MNQNHQARVDAQVYVYRVKRVKLEVLILVAWALLVWYFEGQLQVGTLGMSSQNHFCFLVLGFIAQCLRDWSSL